MREGPPIELLTRRLSVCPREFLRPPKTLRTGEIHVGAVVFDLAGRITGRPVSPEALRPFMRAKKQGVPWLRLVLVACWMLHDEVFQGEMPDLSPRLLAFLEGGLRELSSLVTAEQCVTEPDRREELARMCLDALGILPAGESRAEAKDRLNALDSRERARVLEKTRKAQEHARKVREAMRRKKAREAASKVMRE